MTRKKKCNSESNSFVAAAEQVCLQPVLEHRSDEADVTSLGRLFHTFAPATGKATGTLSRTMSSQFHLCRPSVSV